MGVAGDTVVEEAALDREGAEDTSPPESRRARADRVLLATVGLGAILRFYGLGTQSLWYDEALTQDATAKSLRHVFQHVVGFEGSAPPYFLGMWGWTQIFGRSPESLRFLPALAGVLTIPVVYAALRTLGQHLRVARVAALLVAVNPMLVWYSQEARPYALVALGSAVMVWAYARIKIDPSRANWWLLGGAAAASIALHYLALTLFAALVALLYKQVPEHRRDLRLACIPTVVTLAVLVPFALLQRSKPGYPDWVSALPLDYRLNNAVKSVLVGPGAPDDRLWLVVLAAVVLAVGVLAIRARRDERNTAALLTGLGLFVLVAALAGCIVGVDGVLARYLIAGVVPLVAAVGIGLGSPRAGWVGLLAVGAVCATSVFVVEEVATDPALQRPDWRAIAEVVDPDTGEAIPEDGSRLLILRWTTYGVQPLLDLVDESERLNARNAADVVEIDVLWLEYEPVACDMLVGRVCNMLFVGGMPPEPLAGQLTLVDRVELDQFVIDRYRLPRPMRLDAGDLLPPDARRKSSVLVVTE